MKMSVTLSVIAVTTTVLLLPACKKDHEPDSAHRSQITKLKYDPGISGFGDEAIFTYNNKGNPISITRSMAGTGATDYIFRYDNQHRLTDYSGIYHGGTFEFWNHYYYDAQNRIAGDTVYYFGKVGDNGPIPDPAAPPPYDTLYIGSTDIYQYDNENRIREVIRTFNGGAYVTFRFVYNAAGNLERMSHEYSAYPELNTETIFDQYDNKVNMHRTHPVWQIIDFDFSRNNPFRAQTYNARGLPVKITAPDPKLESVFLLIRYNTLEVEYAPR